ncbi:MAG: response regulator transcription factor [Alphaproteobacteria bacterium]
MTREPIVFVVDDDEAVRDFLIELISSVGLRVAAYASAQEFLDALEPGSLGCALLDIRMPGMSGLELQKELAERAVRLPVIILTGHGDVQVAVHAMRAGAVDFIEKPFNNELLLDRIQRVVAATVDADSAWSKRDEIAHRMDLLTPRERQVLDLVVAGRTNKDIAHRFAISEKTVEAHRAKVMEKMRATSFADLVKMVATLNLD